MDQKALLDNMKKKGHEILELAVDELELVNVPESELKKLISSGSKESLLAYLKKQKKEHLIDIMMDILAK